MALICPAMSVRKVTFCEPQRYLALQSIASAASRRQAGRPGLPGWLDKVWNRELNRWFIGPDTTQWQAYAYVGGWFLVLAICFFLTRRQLKGLIRELSL